MSMESVDASSALIHGDRSRERSLGPVIDRLETECGDVPYFVLEATDETVIPHVYHGVDGANVRSERAPDRGALVQLCARLDQFFQQREALTSISFDEAEDAEYLTTWCREMKVVRLSVPDAEFFIGLAHGSPVVPVVDGILQALDARRGGGRSGDRPIARIRRTED